MDTLKFFWKYPNIVTLMYNIYYHMKIKNFDYPFVICGEPGLGKSMFGFHFYELWYRVILKEKITLEDIKNINAERMEWLKNFKTITEYDINFNDEGADGFSSKDAMTRFGRDIEKLYKVNRKKKFLSPLIVLDFFELPPFFRRRVRGVFYIDKQGYYKYFSKKGIVYLNAYNMNRRIKSYDVARPLFKGVFPDYKGLLREAYDEKSQDSADRILDETIGNNINPDDIYFNKIKELNDQGLGINKIAKKIGKSNNFVESRINKIRINNI